MVALVSLAFACFLATFGSLGAAETPGCKKMDLKSWQAASREWQGRELVAFASWCSSCKDNVMAAKARPDRFVLLAAFDEPEQAEAALRRLGVSAPCVAGDEIVTKFGVTSLPWSGKI